MQPRTTDDACEPVFKIVAADDWRKAIATGAFCGSADDRRDGFIHLSAASQVAATYEKYFRNQSDLVLVAFDSAALGPDLKWETSRGGALFPHYYGALPAALALWQRPIVRSAQGAIPAFEDIE